MGPLFHPLAALPSPTTHPLGQSMIDIAIQLIELPFGVPRPEVVSPAPEHRIQRGDDLLHVFPAVPRSGQLMHALSDSLHRFGRRPPLHVIRARVPLYAPLLSNRAAQKYK